MPQRNVATNFTFEQQRVEINNLAQDFWTQKGTVDTAASTYLKHDGSNAFTGGTLAVPNAFTINSNSGNGTVTIAGNLQVDGTTTTVNTATMDVVDKNITIAKGSANDAAADGAGITIDSATDITWNFVDANDAWVSSIGVEATTFLKGPYGQFTGSGTPTTGQGVEVNAPDANTGQITSYDRGNSAYKELRIKGSSLNVYTGTTNALEATFNDTGLAVEGLTTAKSGLLVGNANQTKAQDGVMIERNSGDGYAHITAGRSGGNYSGFEFYVAGASGVTKRLSIDYESNIQFFKEDGTTAALHIDKDTKIGIGETSPDHLLHLKGDTPIIAAESSSWVNGVSAALRLSYADGDAREIRGHYDNGLMFTTNQGEAMRIDTDGIVNSYFGTTISGTNSATPRFKVTTTNSSPDLRLHTWNDANGMYGLLGVNDYLDANGNNLAATADKKSAGIFLDGRAGKLIFRTKHDSGTSVLDRMIVTSTGYVGIGTTGPAKTGIQNNVSVLQIDSGDGAELILGNSVSQNVSTNHVGAIAFKNIDNSTGTAPHYCGIRSNCTNTSGGMNLKFYGGSTAFEADTPHMLIDSLGKTLFNPHSSGETNNDTVVTIRGWAADTSTTVNEAFKNAPLKIRKTISATDLNGGFLDSWDDGVHAIGLAMNYGGNSGTNAGYHLVFGVNNDTNDRPTEKFRISGNGRAGLGVSNPAVAGGYHGMEIGGHANSGLRLSTTTAGGWAFTDYEINGSQKFIAGCKGGTDSLSSASSWRICSGASFDSNQLFVVNSNGSVLPGSDNTQDFGSSSFRWANVYTGDMHLNNMNSGGNEVDGTEGHWTMQEGSDDLFLINRNTGKKYKFNLTEV